jgi:2-methylaconitate cis-trans-isomerase PrpF
MHGFHALRLSILRGGTSRALFFLANDLPRERGAIEPILLNVFGSPDVRQINGLGGATSQTSKAAIIGPPTRPDADVDYTFAQVSVTQPVVDWGGNCGNISSAVGPFAIDAGLVGAVAPVTTVRIHNTNTGKIIVAQVPVAGGRAMSDGDYAIPGVPGTGARILLDFQDPAGSVSGALLPTGAPRDTLTIGDGRSLHVSTVDASNPVVFLLAEELGMTGTESPQEIERRTDVTDILEEVRGTVAEMLGLVASRADALRSSPGLPKVGMVAAPQGYRTTGGTDIGADAMDLQGRLMSMQTAHRSYMVTGAICTAAAAFIDGTVVHQVARPLAERPSAQTVRIGNPYGIMDATVSAGTGSGVPEILGVAVGRTARHILDGVAYVERDLFASM